MAVYFFFNDGSGDTSWINSNNWWLDASHVSPVGSFPTINSEDTVYVDSEVSSDFDNNVSYSLTNYSTIYTSSSLGIYNTVINNGIFVTDLDLYVSTGTNITNNGTFNMNGETILEGNIINTQEISFSFSFVISGTITNSTTDSVVYFYYDGILNGTINNSGLVSSGNNLINTGAITNDGTFLNAGTLRNRGAFTNNGTLNTTQTADLCMTPNSSLINNGVFIYGSVYTTRVKGPIYPQVPSSISFGGGIVGAIF